MDDLARTGKEQAVCKLLEYKYNHAIFVLQETCFTGWLVAISFVRSPERSQRRTQLRYNLSFRESKRLNKKYVIKHFKVQVLDF